MTSQDLIAWRKHWKLSQRALGELLGVTDDTVRRWEKGTTPVPNMVPLALETIAGNRAQLIKSLKEAKARLVRREKLLAAATQESRAAGPRAKTA